MSRRNPSTPAVEGDPAVEETPAAEGAVVEASETPAEDTLEVPAAESAEVVGVGVTTTPVEPDFTSQLFVPVEEAVAMRKQIVELEELVAKLRTAAAVVEEQRGVEKAVVAADKERTESEHLRLLEENAGLHVQLSGAINDASFANAQVTLYHKQVVSWREALKSLAPLVAYVEGKGAHIKDEGVIMRLGDAYITFGDLRSWAGVFKT